MGTILNYTSWISFMNSISIEFRQICDRCSIEVRQISIELRQVFDRLSMDLLQMRCSTDLRKKFDSFSIGFRQMLDRASRDVRLVWIDFRQMFDRCSIPFCLTPFCLLPPAGATSVYPPLSTHIISMFLLRHGMGKPSPQEIGVEVLGGSEGLVIVCASAQ